MCVCVRTCMRLVPDVAVEDLPQRVQDTHQGRHGGEEDDARHGTDALQHRVHPHARHLVYPVGPAEVGGGGDKESEEPVNPSPPDKTFMVTFQKGDMSYSVMEKKQVTEITSYVY